MVHFPQLCQFTGGYYSEYLNIPQAQPPSRTDLRFPSIIQYHLVRCHKLLQAATKVAEAKRTSTSSYDPCLRIIKFHQVSPVECLFGSEPTPGWLKRSVDVDIQFLTGFPPTSSRGCWTFLQRKNVEFESFLRTQDLGFPYFPCPVSREKKHAK